MSTASAIFRSYRAPRAVARSFRDAGADDGTGLGWLFGACILFFLAQLPELQRTAHLSGGDTPFFGLALGTFFGTLLLAPIVIFLVASVSGYIARAVGWGGTVTDARLAMFWGLLASAPLVLIQGALSGLIGTGPAASILALAAFVAFFWVWVNGLIALGTPVEAAGHDK
ncbi:hypothetical protein C8N43_0496 [Litoreibacter ponti]|uniref:Yip1-like protein n=1 Tax=Litoreibacter ponti TaxID=1510457 RepID=A0A2T6BIG7_9RHOB|nr:YIP1 family protein [Litoreibacter ponti]PTX55849.1 hypothetical protein C8N43_0496 [Litoreibacter ponti]